MRGGARGWSYIRGEDSLADCQLFRKSRRLRTRQSGEFSIFTDDVLVSKLRIGTRFSCLGNGAKPRSSPQPQTSKSTLTPPKSSGSQPQTRETMQPSSSLQSDPAPRTPEGTSDQANLRWPILRIDPVLRITFLGRIISSSCKLCANGLASSSV
jgi:hypothetical protein